MQEQELLARLALLRAPGIGGTHFKKLIDHFGSAEQTLKRPTEAEQLLTRRYANRDLSKPDWVGAEQDLAWQSGENNAIIVSESQHYPNLLREIPDHPPLLFVHGNVNCLKNVQIAMVGSRTPSPMGEETAYEFAKHLGTQGFTITSGLALGVDAASHRGALKAGAATIAVTGTGLDRVYPAKHRDLAHQIADNGGALVSEFATGTTPMKENFPRRNRIISGLAIGTLVVEAARQSGSLITAKMAGEQGREVFAIPGSIHNPLARGCHALIRQGAKLVETAEDILEEFNHLISQNSVEISDTNDLLPELMELDQDYQNLLNCMGYDTVAVDQLIDRSGLTAEAVSSMLLVLELQGHIQTAPGGCFSRTMMKGIM